ncbi:MAG: hypothetical protein QOJ42_7044 [Acidobacteriaceae bacterium]|nr:hypothetical protein [Acidobacteriaceae bacterium]MEA3007346.1 hypothetical protein [Acidobacteriaceae bacterium]
MGRVWPKHFPSYLGSFPSVAFLWSDAEHAACPGILEHPKRAIGPHFHVADSVADIPAFGRLGPALTVEDDAVERLAAQAAHQGGALPLREHRAVIEDEVAWRDANSSTPRSAQPSTRCLPRVMMG